MLQSAAQLAQLTTASCTAKTEIVAILIHCLYCTQLFLAAAAAAALCEFRVSAQCYGLDTRFKTHMIKYRLPLPAGIMRPALDQC